MSLARVLAILEAEIAVAIAAEYGALRRLRLPMSHEAANRRRAGLAR